MKKSLRIFVCLLTLVVFTVPMMAVSAHANAAPPPLLYVNSKDSAHPLLFQALMPGEEADGAKLAPTASIPAGTTEASVYVAFTNTGWWTQGTIGLLTGQMVRENQYVALEVDETGAPLAEGEIYALKYYAGYFLLTAVIQEPQRLGVFQLTTEGGITVTGRTTVLEGTTITQSTAEYQVLPESPLGNVVLDCHISAP